MDSSTHVHTCVQYLSTCDINPNVCTDVQYRGTVHNVTPITHVRTDVQYSSTVHQVTSITHVRTDVQTVVQCIK